MAMDHHNEITGALRIRCKDRIMAEAWLCEMHVSKHGLGTTPINWAGILRNSTQYKFHPRFSLDESVAYKIFSKDIAQGFARILLTMGMNVEIDESLF